METDEGTWWFNYTPEQRRSYNSQMMQEAINSDIVPDSEFLEWWGNNKCRINLDEGYQDADALLWVFIGLKPPPPERHSCSTLVLLVNKMIAMESKEELVEQELNNAC